MLQMLDNELFNFKILKNLVSKAPQYFASFLSLKTTFFPLTPYYVNAAIGDTWMCELFLIIFQKK